MVVTILEHLVSYITNHVISLISAHTRPFLEDKNINSPPTPPCNIQVRMPLLPYLSAAVTAAGPSYKPYITRSGPERSPQSQLRVQITSHLATPFCLLSTLLTVTQAAKTPSRQLTHTDTQFCVRAHQAQNTLAQPGVNHHTKSALQSPVGSQRAAREERGDLDDLID